MATATGPDLKTVWPCGGHRQGSAFPGTGARLSTWLSFSLFGVFGWNVTIGCLGTSLRNRLHASMGLVSCDQWCRSGLIFKSFLMNEE
jgi:hypothetical protein